MRYSLGSGGRRSAPGPRSLAAAALALLALAGMADAEVARAAPAQVPADTVRPIPRLGTGALFRTEYLSRILRADPKDLQPDVEIVVEAPADVRVAAYAERYRISPELARRIHDTALAEGVDPDLAFRLVWTESRFKTRARGPHGALGLTQLMPSTARGIDRSVRTEAQILDPSTNLRLGFRYLREMIERYDGNVRLGLLAYNRGEVAVNRALRSGRDPENGYSRKVLGKGPSVYRGKGLLSKGTGNR